MSKNFREILIQALKDPESYEAYFAKKCMTKALQTQDLRVNTFSEEDLMLRMVDHDRPLYVTVESDGISISRILIDPGSSINLMSLKVLRGLSLDIQHLGRDKLMVHEFNKKSNKTLGSFILPLKFKDLYTEAKFHIIDVDTSFRALLGRLWLHEYGMVLSTMHQCMKYLKDREEFKILDNLQPFSVNEAKTLLP